MTQNNDTHSAIDMVGAISQLYATKDTVEIQNRLKKLSAEDMINLFTLVDQLLDNTEDRDIANLEPKGVDRSIMLQIHDILGDFESGNSESAPQDRLDKIKSDIQDISAKNNTDEDEKTDLIMGKIKEIKSAEDLRLIWPSIDAEIKKSILSASDTENVPEDGQPAKVLAWVQKNIMERVIYRNTIVEMRIPHGPNNTVGVWFNNRLAMVPRRDIKQINEHAMTKVAMPSLVRIQQLAGLSVPQVDQGHTGGAVAVNAIHADINQNLQVLRADINVNNWTVALDTLEKLKSSIEQMVAYRDDYENS
jgi:hypothetical protein